MELTPNPNWWGDAGQGRAHPDHRLRRLGDRAGGDQRRRGRLHLPAVLPGHRRTRSPTPTSSRASRSAATTRRCTSRWARIPPTPARSPTRCSARRSSSRSTARRCSQQIYAPLVEGAELLQCGPIVPGDYCTDAWADVTYDPEGAEHVLTDAGWTKNGDGFWADPDGDVPSVRWMVNTGNTRRESTQAYLIPLLAQAGFNVVADNCEALPCVFQQRLPSARLRHGHVHHDRAAGPVVPDQLDSTCDQIPTEANGNQGQNQQGWLQRGSVRAARTSPTSTVDEAERAELITDALELLSDRGTSCSRCSSSRSRLLPHRPGGRAGRRRAEQLPGVQEPRRVGGRRR